MMPIFYMLVGLPGSGKSYHAQRLKAIFEEAHNKELHIHSSDAIREELFSDVNNQQNNTDVFNLLHKRIKEDLLAGVSVVYDATNTSYKRRKAFLEELKKIECMKVCNFIATPYEVCLEQNNSRERKVPEDVIDRMYRNFDVPYYFEGWDKINVIYLRDSYKNTYGTCGEFVYDTCDFNQDNSHHLSTLGNHCLQAYNFLKETTHRDVSIVAEAAMIHDNGKPYCKTFIDSKGRDSKDAHYYNHEHVGSYNSLFYETSAESDEERLLISFLIRWHMQMYFIDKQPHTRHKYLNMFGYKNFFYLELLNRADREAH